MDCRLPRSMAGQKLGFRRSPCQLLISASTSCLLVLFSQLALASIPRLFRVTLIAMLPASAVILFAALALGRLIRRLLGISAPAPAVVVFTVLFVWGVYVALVRPGKLSFADALINLGCPLLLSGLYKIHYGDPGLVKFVSSCSGQDQHACCEAGVQYKNQHLVERVRICQSCKASIKGFDHHCPAFGTCIGQKNHRLFMLLVVGFILVESSYVMCSTQFISNSMDAYSFGFENNLSGSLVIGTLLFSCLQLIWQVLFLIWHLYCICANIKTDEWINWRKYPEFQFVVQPQPGLTASGQSLGRQGSGIHTAWVL